MRGSSHRRLRERIAPQTGYLFWRKLLQLNVRRFLMYNTPSSVRNEHITAANEIKMERAVGIDLGTTYSVASYLDETGNPVTARNMEGELTTPSVVLFDDDEVIVGNEALKAMAWEAEHVADCAKRDIGQRSYHKSFGGKDYPPEVIQAYILRKIKRDTAQIIGDFKHAVITVPAYFDEVRRKATQDAALIAGVEVLDIINEPTAAALAYGIELGFLSSDGSSADKQNILVYDLGGGTFDVTLMELKENHFRTLATDGDVQLGGRDWDQRLVDHVGDEFQQKFKFDPRGEANAAGVLWRECEDAKRTLSTRKETTIACDFKGNAMAFKMTREHFERLTADLLDRTAFTTREVLKASGLNWANVDRVLLAGGSTRMPMISKMLSDMTGKTVHHRGTIDEIVAHGAALRAGLLLKQNNQSHPKFKLTNVNSHSLGVAGIDPQTGEEQTVFLIPRNRPLPAKVKQVFRTKKSGQRSILVKIVEGESFVPEHCQKIGSCVVKNLPANLPAKSPVEVEFSYQSNGRLSVNVTVPNTSIARDYEIDRVNGLDAEKIERWRRKLQED